MITPVDFKKYPITQGWGVNPQVYAQFGLKGHNGIDIATPNSTDIFAPHKGKVIEVAFDAPGYGLYMKIENDIEGSVLCHLKENLLAIGADVMEGQLCAKSNNTGFSTGPHLHWGYYRKPRNRNDGYLGYIDPLPFIMSQPVPTDSIDDLKRKIEELKANEINLRKQIETISREKDAILAELSKVRQKVREVIIKLQETL